MTFGRLPFNLSSKSPGGQFREDLELSDLARKIKALSADSDDETETPGQFEGHTSRSHNMQCLMYSNRGALLFTRLVCLVYRGAGVVSCIAINTLSLA